MADQELDCKNMNCPMPIVMISKAMKKLEKGQTLKVVATDPAFEADLRAWAGRLHHNIVDLTQGDICEVTIEKS